MGLIKHIQSKSQAEKIRIMWMITIAVVLLLILVWVLSYRWQRQVPKDLRLFNTIDQGVKDIKNNYGK